MWIFERNYTDGRGELCQIISAQLFLWRRPTIPIYFPTDQFAKRSPSGNFGILWENVIVTSLEKLKNGGWGFSKRKLYPCRGILVEFKESSIYSGMVYHLVQSEVIKIDKSSWDCYMKNTLPDTPPEQEEFENWVNQSINAASRNLFNDKFQENIIASNLNATYLCDNLFTSNLISKHFDVNETIENFYNKSNGQYRCAVFRKHRYW